jgi:hypothetical protein
MDPHDDPPAGKIILRNQSGRGRPAEFKPDGILCGIIRPGAGRIQIGDAAQTERLCLECAGRRQARNQIMGKVIQSGKQHESEARGTIGHAGQPRTGVSRFC